MTRYARSYSRIAAALLALTAACGSGRPAPASKFSALRMQDRAELDTENGLIAVGLSEACLSLALATAPPVGDPPPPDPLLLDPTLAPTLPPIDPFACGILGNGMPPNLLGLQGLHPNSLTEDHFKKWFAADPKTANALMKYLVKCSLPLGVGMSFDYGGITYFWPGLLGFAPHWASGESIPENEQQLVTACLGAHANRYGAHVPISLLGRDADRRPLAMSGDELSSFPVTEGCFFGNVFRKDGVFSASDRPVDLMSNQSSLRACALPDRTGAGGTSMCAPIKYAGSCRDLCRPDPTNTYYLNCTVSGKSYLALTTRIQRNVEYTCGDGVCQVTESCGTGSSWNDCGLDCGPCN
jgi:hypothetical protein